MDPDELEALLAATDLEPSSHRRQSDDTSEQQNDASAIEIAQALQEDDPIHALRIAKTLAREHPRSHLWIARCHVAMGSLTAAAREYNCSKGKEAADELKQLKEWAFVRDYMAHLMRMFFPRREEKPLVHESPSSRIFDGEFQVPACPALDAGGINSELHLGFRIYSPPDIPITSATENPPASLAHLGVRRSARGVLLYFHGNAEVASDYEDLAPIYHWLGFHVMVVDYRGYGWSTPTDPLMSRLLADAEPLVVSDHTDVPTALDTALAEAKVSAEHASRVILVGRSMGSNVAVHLAALAPARFAGLILDSAIGSGRDIMRHHGFSEDGLAAEGKASDGLVAAPGGVAVVGIGENLGKMRRIELPLQVIHGDTDQIVPPSCGVALHAASAASVKHLELIAGRGHNDLAQDPAYFGAIRRFCEQVLPPPGGRL